MNKRFRTTDRTGAVTGSFRRARLYAVLAAAPLTFGGAANTVAQSGNDQPAARAQLQEVVVTATRRASGLQNVAASISAMSGADLEEQGITDFEEITESISGLYLESTQSSINGAVRIRGVGSGGYSRTASSVGVLVDDVYQAREGAAFTELMDVERIEVLRGPQGTLFGKNTTAGVIHIHTKDPVLDAFSGKVEGTFGNYDRRDVRGVVNVPLIEDKLAMRITGYTNQRDGYTDNNFLDEDTTSKDNKGGRIKLMWNATDNLNLLWSSDYSSTAGDLNQGLVEYGSDHITNGLPLSGQPWSEFAAELGKTLPPIELGEHAQNHSEFEDEVERHSLTVNWSLPGHNLKSVTAYQEVDSYLQTDRDNTVLELSKLYSEPVQETTSQEFTLSSEWEGPLSYVAGVFYLEEELVSPTTITTGPDQIALGAAPVPPTVSTTNRNNETLAGYGTVTYNLTDQWAVVGGLRYTENDKQSYSTLEIPGLPTVVPVDRDKTFSELTYTAKLRYYFAGGNMAYLSVDHGFKSGGFNRQNTVCALTGGATGCLSEDQLVYDPETTDSIELGLKSQWLDNRLRLNGAVFYQIYEDFQVTESLQEQGTVLVSNAAEVESMGIEMDLTAAVTDNMTVNSSMTWVNTEYDSYDNAPCALTSQPGCTDGTQDLGGEQLPNAPELTANVGVEYRDTIAGPGNLEWFGRLNAAYRGDANLSVYQAEKTEQDAYTLYNGRVGLEPAGREWKLTLWGKNLTDEEYSVMSDYGPRGLVHFQGMPRSYGVTAEWNF